MRRKFILVLVGSLASASEASAQSSSFPPMALNSYSTLPARFSSARVYSEQGALIGNIQRVDHTPAGSPSAVLIGIAGPRVVSLPASAASYDQPANIVITDDAALKLATSNAPR